MSSRNYNSYYAVGTDDAPFGIGETESAAWAEAQSQAPDDENVRLWPGWYAFSVSPAFAAYIAWFGKWPVGYAQIENKHGDRDIDPGGLPEMERAVISAKVERGNILEPGA
jgi:hypothetical protein